MTCSAQQLPAACAGSAPHKAEVHAQAAVLAAALQAHKYAIRHRSPLWVFGVAVHAHLQVAPAVGPRSKAGYASLALSVKLDKYQVGATDLVFWAGLQGAQDL